MNLFINTVSWNSYLAIFDDNRKIISDEYISIKWNESSLLIPNLESFLKKNNLNFDDIKNIITVNWPWSFTWVRTSTLVVNTISFITKAKITPISYFDLFSSYPIIKASSKRDSFFKFSKEDEIEIISNELLESKLKNLWINKIHWEWNLKDIEIIENIDYYGIINSIKLNNLTQIDPLYLKKPNIC